MYTVIVFTTSDKSDNIIDKNIEAVKRNNISYYGTADSLRAIVSNSIYTANGPSWSR